MKRKIISIFLIISMLLFSVSSAFAVNLESVTLVKFADPVRFLKYGDSQVGYSMVGHVLEGVNYPAYCIEPVKPGVYEKDSYQVQIKGAPTDRNIIKIIQNGYPYKSAKELGVNTDQEAYYCTKVALWCYVRNRNINDYLPIKQEYQYILDASKNIYYAGMSDTTTIDKANLEVRQLDNIHIDKDCKYYEQTFEVVSNYNINNYSVNIKSGNVPEGTKVVDSNNNAKTNFYQNEKFKILIPLDKIILDRGEVLLNIKADIKTQNVFYGDAIDSLQDHAITIMPNEEMETQVKVEYKKVYGKIKIIKRSLEYNKYTDKNAETVLAGAKFLITNSNGEKVDEIVTNAEGIAISKDLPRGKYIVKEVLAPDFYLTDGKEHFCEILRPNETIEFNVSNGNVDIKVKVEKEGPKEVKSGENMTYNFHNIENLSNVDLEEFYWKDIIPTDAIRITKLKIGTWNEELEYKLKYRTNLTEEYIEFPEVLKTNTKYEIDLNKESLNLLENEYITEVMLEFGKVKKGFRENEDIIMEAKVLEDLPNGYNFENITNVKGIYLGRPTEDEDKVKTVVYTPTEKHEIILPKTGKN